MSDEPKRTDPTDQEIAELSTTMLHKATHPLVVAAFEKADPTPTEAALIDALDATADLTQAWAKKAKANAAPEAAA